MRIEPTNAAQINSVASTAGIGRGAKPSTITPGSEHLSGDTANLSQIRSLVAKAMGQSEIRTDKVEGIKAQIAASTYEVNPSKIADAMISDEF